MSIGDGGHDTDVAPTNFEGRAANDERGGGGSGGGGAPKVDGVKEKAVSLSKESQHHKHTQPTKVPNARGREPVQETSKHRQS